MSFVSVRLCGTVLRTTARLHELLRSAIDSKQYKLQYRNLAWWQTKTHKDTQKHIAALKTKMEVSHPEPACTGEESTSTRQKPQFGTRFLTDPQSVFQHNAWDNVVWDEKQEAEALQKTLEQLQDALSPEQQEKYEQEANMHWDKFYDQHQNRFFKDRHWLFTEFPELYSPHGNTSHGAFSVPDPSVTTLSSSASSAAQHQTGADATPSQESLECGFADSSCCVKDCGLGMPSENRLQKVMNAESDVFASDGTSSAGIDNFIGESASFRILEVGCGVGNTVFPVLHTNNDPGLMMYCCDFSTTAVQLVKDHPDYDPKRCHAFVWDITDEDACLPFPLESLDVIIMIFVLSAVHPDKMQGAVNRLASYLKPGGQILLRDYGRFDMAQLRFKKGRCLSENFYVRGDGTRVYFFTQEEFRTMFQHAGLEEVQNLIDRRLQVNRGRQLKMYRVWIQCKYRKPAQGAASAEVSTS